MLQMFSIFGALNFTIIPTLGAAAVENGIFLFLPIIIRRHTADFLAREFDFL